MSKRLSDDRAVILLADDDPADQTLLIKALAKSGHDCRVEIVEDGQELIDYLQQAGAYSDARAAPRPTLIILDLNMPRLDGRAALRILKSDHDLRRIPIVVLSTSDRESDVVQCYDLGANSYVTKPSSYPELKALARNLESYWIDLVRTPHV